MFLTQVTPIAFKSIYLNDKEKKAAQRNLDTLNKRDSQTARDNLLKIFDRHIKREVEYRYSCSLQKDDYLQSYYLALFDAISQKLPLDKIIRIVNKPDIDSNIVYHQFSQEIPLSNNMTERLTDENLPKCMSFPNNARVQYYEDKLDEVCQNLRPAEQEALLTKIHSKKNTDRDNRLGRIAVSKIKKENNILPENYHISAQMLKDMLWSDKDKDEIISFLVNYPSMLYLTPEDILNRTAENSKNLNISKEKFIKVTAKNPVLLCLTPENIKEKKEGLSKIFKTDDIGAIFLKDPHIITYDIENLKSTITQLSEIMGVSENDIIKLITKSPTILHYNLETLDNKINEFAKELNVSRQEIIKIAKDLPQILNYSVKTLSGNIKTVTQALDSQPENYVSAGIRRPTILCMKPEKLINNITNLAAGFGITKEEMAQIALKQPALFYMPPESLFDNINKSIELLQDDDFKAKALKNTSLMLLKPETIYKKRSLYNYCRILSNKPVNSVIRINNDEYFFCEMLRILINKKNSDKILQAKNSKASIVKYIQEHSNGNYNFEIPDDKYTADKLIEFTKEFCQSNFGKQIIKLEKYEYNPN